LNNTATTIYTFTPTAGQCATTTTLTITVNSNITPTFSAVAPICSGAALSALPTTSNNGINGTWSPALNNTATTIYTFTPTLGQCATTATLTIIVNSNITPTFSAVAPICSGATLSALPTTSNNGINGTWSPALNNTATTIYTFTPTTGQCATTTTLTITVNSNTTPTFTAVSPICSGATLSALPTTSNNGINGTWSPALNNAATTIYTFTPTLGQCATTTTLTITVNSNTTPTFTAVSPICSGATLSALPTTSNNGINGTWSPALNNTATTIYTFTPTAGQCATTTTLTITVNSNLTPNFATIPAMCFGSTMPVLDATSPNGINGTWTPATISNTTSGSYTFTPNAGQCSTIQVLNVTITTQTIPNFAAITAFCSGSVAPILGATSPNGITGTWSPAIINNTTSGTYTFTPNTGQCATTQTLTTTVNTLITPNFAAIPEFCSGSVAPILGTTSPNGVVGTWAPAIIDNITSGTYTFSPAVGQCATTQVLIVTVNPIPTITISSIPIQPTICLGQNTVLTGSGADTYIWVPGGITGNSIDVFPPTTTVYTVTGTMQGCTGSATVTVNVNPTPIITANPSTICAGDNSTLTGSGASTYIWNPGGLTGESIIVSPTVTTSYSVIGTSAAGCTGSATVTVTVSTAIVVSVSPQSDSICRGSSISLSASGADSYTWSPSNSLSNSTGSQVIASPNTTTTYSVHGTNILGCTGSATATIFIYPDPPFSFSMFPGEGCEPLMVSFEFDTNNMLIDQNSLLFNFGDPSSGNNTSSNLITSHFYDEHGFYIVKLTGTSIYGCPVTYYDTVKVFKKPIADFTTRPEILDMNNPLIRCYDQSYYATSWSWTFGDPDSDAYNYSDYQNPTHLYSDTGNYEIILVVSNSNNCYDSAKQIIRVIPTFEFWTPNAFTPDGDGTNDNFFGKGVGFRTDNFEMFVYDRWGKLIFSKTGYDEVGWDGTYNNNGKVCEQGVYTFLINLTEVGGIKHVYKGVTTLIR
jgi:gliding motility-associated-like protein